jgi:hypothetical protein
LTCVLAGVSGGWLFISIGKYISFFKSATYFELFARLARQINKLLLALSV